MHRNKSVDIRQFSMIPRADIPRSSFKCETTHKTTFDAGYIVPVYVDEVLPGDTFRLKMTAFARLATPLFPIMDNLHMDSFFFYVPLRLLWNNFQKFMGERIDPDDSIDFLVPRVTVPANGFAVHTIFDYFGLPTVGQVTAGSGGNIEVAAFWSRAYNLIWNEWFRDENLQDSLVVDLDDGPDDPADYVLKRRGKRHDYFTSCLPWPQKGDAVTLPLGDSAPVLRTPSASPWIAYQSGTDTLDANVNPVRTATTSAYLYDGTNYMSLDPNGGLYADLSDATAATINALRTSFQVQKLLERDARGGTRYTEIVLSHFGVRSPDARLQRPEYLGGGSTPININPIAQTSATNITGGSSPQGNLAAMGTALAGGHGFTQSFTEHGIILGLVNVRADLTYQQGVRRMWSRSTRYDFYWPAFAMLGEQAVLSKEIYCTGNVNDENVFGYQERWAEYRHHPSMITGLFRSTETGTIDVWHLAQEFGSRPTLGNTFIQETPPLERVLAVGSEANGKQFLFDSFFEIIKARPMPLFSVPGLIDHF